MLRYCNGDNGAFDLLYQRHKGPLYRYMLRMIRNTASTDELYQDVWMRIINGRQRYQVQGRFRAWLFQIAHNRIMDHFRRQRPEISMEDSTESATWPVQAASNPEDLVLNQQFAGRLLEKLDELPPLQREVFLLREEAGLSLSEIAGLTKTSDEGAKSRLRYALAKLRRGLSEFVT